MVIFFALKPGTPHAATAGVRREVFACETVDQDFLKARRRHVRHSNFKEVLR
jgi:hypothetical protein